MTGHVCPECGTDDRATDAWDGGPHGRPGAGPRCGCAERAARRAAERAETAAAEDFDPLRIRPYVTLGGDEAPADAAPADAAMTDAAMTMPLFLDRAAPEDPPPLSPPPPLSQESAGADDPRTDAMAVDLGLVDPVRPRRQRPFAVLAVGAAAVGVVGIAAFAGGLFGGDGNGDSEHDRTLPSAHVSSIPDAPLSPDASPSASASASVSSSPSASALPSASASASASTSLSPSASAASSRPPAPSASATVSQPTGTSTDPSLGKPQGRTLQRGDHGTEVAELQRRLQEVSLYQGPDNGNYTDRVENAVRAYQSYKSVEGDPPGVYGPSTRSALEAETTGRGQS
ncbi:peptidoglycan-binding protein [Streptomyces sp. NBC_00873]|uniref:peptidoglycan-binding domain-containing protein n=1 Tax=Streptomyces sp. NBC_00873 TaxID=2975852 RepID=UPI003868CE93|nr:peptidoglycan-binding protein [Streptomyces sp. NBC_00873]